MRPLPEEPFEAYRWLTPRVDRFAQVTVRTNKYSVPVRLIGRRVRVLLHASDLVIYDGRAEAARHERLPGESGTHLDLDHYLEALVRKPGALPGSTALEQARAAGKFTPVHDAWWAAARKAHGDAAGDQGAGGGAAAPPHGQRACRRGTGSRAAGRGADRRRGRVGGPQGRRRGRRPADRRRHAVRPAGGRVPDRPPPGEAATRHPPAAVGRRLRPAAPPQPHPREGTASP